MSDQDKCEDKEDVTGSTVSYSASYGVGTSSGAGSNYSVNAQGAVKLSGANVTSNAAGYPAYGSTYQSSGVSYKTEETAKQVQSKSPSLPDIVFVGEGPLYEQIRIVYFPEHDISARDALKLSTLFYMKAHDRMHEFGIYQYIRENNLERHFKMELY